MPRPPDEPPPSTPTDRILATLSDLGPLASQHPAWTSDATKLLAAVAADLARIGQGMEPVTVRRAAESIANRA